MIPTKFDPFTWIDDTNRWCSIHFFKLTDIQGKDRFEFLGTSSSKRDEGCSRSQNETSAPVIGQLFAVSRMQVRKYDVIRIKENCFPHPRGLPFYIPVTFGDRGFKNFAPEYLIARLTRSVSYLERISGREFSETLENALAPI